MTRWWVAAIVTAANALTSAGFALAALATAAGPGKTNAMYAAARALPLAAAAVWLVSVRSTRALAALAVVLGVVQACDAFIGVTLHDASKTIGPAVFAVATLWLAPSLNRS